MVASGLDLEKTVRFFREIVKRKTSYNEMNLHYEYFKRVGDTIPFKAHGFQSLREFIQIRVGYFSISNVLLEIWNSLHGDDWMSFFWSKERKKVTVVKPFEQCGLYGPENGKNSGSETANRVHVSNNIYFGQAQSTGVNNPFQNIRNDIEVSFRGVDRCTANNRMTSESSRNNGKKVAILNDTTRSVYLSAQNDDEHMDMNDLDDSDFSWDDKYCRLKITHVATSGISARFIDEFEVKF